MRYYELMMVVPQMDDDGLSATLDRVNNDIGERGGTVVRQQRWGGNRRLAYPINNHNEGSYVLTHLELDPERASELEANLRVSEHVLRHLLLRIDSIPEVKETPPQPAPAAEETAEAASAEAPVAADEATADEATAEDAQATDSPVSADEATAEDAPAADAPVAADEAAVEDAPAAEAPEAVETADEPVAEAQVEAVAESEVESAPAAEAESAETVDAAEAQTEDENKEQGA